MHGDGHTVCASLVSLMATICVSLASLGPPSVCVLTTTGRASLVSQVGVRNDILVAVPIDVAWPVATRLRRDGRVARPFLGFRFHQAPDGAGVVVVEVARGSPAEASGLEPGDRLLEFDGAQVGRVRDVTTRLVAVKPGQRLKLRIQRDGEGSAREVVIEARERSAPG